MCNFDHFMYFALFEMPKKSVFCSLSHLHRFFHVILMIKSTFMDKKIYFFVFEKWPFVLYFIKFFIQIFVHIFTIFNSFYAK